MFLVAPSLELPGSLLPAIAGTSRLKMLHPPSHMAPHITSLRLTHNVATTDVSIAGLIYHLPHLETLKLKGCTRAGVKTMQTLTNRCSRLRSLNLRGIRVDIDGFRHVLEQFHAQLESLKIDDIKAKVRVLSL
jgi:hypothetical protein